MLFVSISNLYLVKQILFPTESELLTPFTALKHCQHTFCNQCWEVHLKTQISLGNTDLQCPGHKCDVCVDKATIIALVPTW